MKNFSLFKIFSFPLITIFVDKNNSKQNFQKVLEGKPIKKSKNEKINTTYSNITSC